MSPPSAPTSLFSTGLGRFGQPQQQKGEQPACVAHTRAGVSHDSDANSSRAPHQASLTPARLPGAFSTHPLPPHFVGILCFFIPGRRSFSDVGFFEGEVPRSLSAPVGAISVGRRRTVGL